MSEALLSAFVTLIVCLINNFFQSRQTDKKNEEMIGLIQYKIEELTKRVDKHNNVIERTFKLEEQTAVQEEKIKNLSERIKN